MSSGSHRRRLVKKSVDDSDNYRIPKKAPSQVLDRDFEKSGVSRRSFSSDESLDDFITDKVEYQSQDLPSSSEESAHSTDEENRRRKRKRESEASEEEESAHETSSVEEDSPEPSVSPQEEKTLPDPTRNLIGKEALEAKRAQGLLPPKTKKDHEKHHHKHKDKKKKHIREHKPRSEKESKKYVQFGEFDTPEQRKKADLVTKILVRWWYALPEWPPHMDSYPLSEKHLRLVDPTNWLVEPVLDDQGREKVREVPGYPGVFQNSKGVVFDLRDATNAPSFNNLFQRPIAALKKLLATALETQLKELKALPDYDQKLAKELTRELKFIDSGE